MTNVLSMLLILGLLTFCLLYCYKLFLQCKLLSAKLPKKSAPKKRKKKIVYADDLDD